MKILICLLISFTAFAQQESRKFGVAEIFYSGDSIFIKKLITRVINVSEGVTTKMRTPPDTATLFIAPDGGIYEGIITWKKVGGVVEPPISQVDTVDFSPAAITYSANWARKGEPPLRSGWYKGTISYSTAGTASHKFNGKRIEIWGERGATGSADVIIDGQSHTVSWNGQFGLPVMIFAKDIPAGDHEITIAPKGDGNVLVDFLVVYR